MIVIQMQLAQTQLEVITAPATLDSLEMDSTAQVCEGYQQSDCFENRNHSSEFLTNLIQLTIYVAYEGQKCLSRKCTVVGYVEL